MSNKKLVDEFEAMNMGHRIKNLRKRKKLSRASLARIIGVSHQQIYKYENGINAISVSGIKKIAAALGVDPCEIFGCLK